MNSSDQIEQLVNEALNSADGAGRAVPKPFLFTRLKARIERSQGRQSAWETAGRFIARPAVAFAGLCLVIGINAVVIAYNKPVASASASEPVAASDEFTTSVNTLDYTVNIEP